MNNLHGQVIYTVNKLGKPVSVDFGPLQRKKVNGVTH